VIDTRGEADAIVARAQAGRINLRRIGDQLGISLDETVTDADLAAIVAVFAGDRPVPPLQSLGATSSRLPAGLLRQSDYLTHPVFHRYRSETELMRYLRRLADKDLALDRTMIPLGSCTMKLNAAAEMAPISWPEFAHLHPFVPSEQAAGYLEMIRDLERMLCETTGYDAVSLQPNAGSQGEYAGLLAIRAYHASRGEAQRVVCLIPASAHGTNPATAQMAGMRVVVVK
jgi:glycine dehydrogenase